MKNPEALADAIFNQVSAYVARRLEPLQERIATLESEAAHLKNFGYQGTWQKGAIHHKGNFVTDGGGMWCCMRDNAKSRPGTNGDEWRLCVKRGAVG